MKKNILSIKLLVAASALIVVSLCAASPAAAIDYEGHWNRQAENSGSSCIYMTSIYSTFCFLTKVDIEETDTSNENARCAIFDNGEDFYLCATLGKSSDADVYCSAECYSRD